MHVSTSQKLYDLFHVHLFKNFLWMEDVLLTGKKGEGSFIHGPLELWTAGSQGKFGNLKLIEI